MNASVRGADPNQAERVARALSLFTSQAEERRDSSRRGEQGPAGGTDHGAADLTLSAVLG